MLSYKGLDMKLPALHQLRFRPGHLKLFYKIELQIIWHHCAIPNVHQSGKVAFSNETHSPIL